MPSKDLYIPPWMIHLVEVEGSCNIPTAIFYETNGHALIGNTALAKNSNGSELTVINRDFKIDLARYAPSVKNRLRYMTASRIEKSAVELANDFLYEVQKIAKQWLLAKGITECKHIVVAEPLSMHTEGVSPDWLPNYRKTLGGTCDVCVIQTTKAGDISGSHEKKLPLAGKSCPVGGVTLNRAIAESLIKRVPGLRESQVKTALREYKEWNKGRRTLETLDRRYRVFIENFHDLTHRVETLKLSLSRSVTDWSLEADQRFSVPIAVPQDPFDKNDKKITLTMSITELRDIFEKYIYVPKLQPFFTDRFKACHEVFERAPLRVILLSGGSANLGWLRTLLLRDFTQYLGDASFVLLPDYQEVVAKGLAVDCAREFETGTSDFKGVTYNPLFLLLNADSSGCEPRAFTPRTKNLPEVRQRPGLLLPTASFMTSFIDEPMQWRVKLNRAPRQNLEYFFLQGSMDPADVQNLQNVEETTIHTPPCRSFDSTLQVQLTVRSDGTALPKFIYKAGEDGSGEIAKEGRKFFVDMTDASEGGSEAYLGLDFGTSNSAVSYIDRASVQQIENRYQDPNWRDLGELVDLLPAPLALPLARYIGDFTESSPVPPGFGFIEAGLCLAAYISYVELCCINRGTGTRFFRTFPHRSATHLWLMLKAVQENLSERAVISQPFQRLLEGKNRGIIDGITRHWADTRHELTNIEKEEVYNAVQLLANVCHAVFSTYVFGFFQAVQSERFSSSFRGRFRIAHGKPPFTSFVSYSGPQSFSEAQAFVLSIPRGEGLLLSPLVFWYPCRTHRDVENGHCFLLDKIKNEGSNAIVRFKAAELPCPLEIKGTQNEMGNLVSQLLTFKSQDPELERVSGLVLKEQTHD